MKITYLGHSTVHIDTGDYKLLIDPFITGNPSSSGKADSIQADYILLTHAHSDHIGDAEPIARRTGAEIVAIVELAHYFARKELKTSGLNLGGSFPFPFGRLRLTPALHTSSIEVEGTNIYMGVPAGIVLELDGLTIYHAGDTALFSDMKLIGERSRIDLAFLPIGDYFTMGPEDALTAAKWLQARHVVPIHYNTFGLIQQDGDLFVRTLKESGIQGRALMPGEFIQSSELG